MIKQYRYLSAKENKKVVSRYILKGFLYGITIPYKKGTPRGRLGVWAG